MIQGDRGVVALARGEYVEALNTLYPVAQTYWGDVAYICERVLTLDELKDFVDAKVRVSRQPATSDSTQEIYDPNTAVVLTSQISDERVGETGAAGIPGTTSNVPGKQAAKGVKPTAEADSQAQGLHTENKTFAVSKMVRHVLRPSGNLKRITAAVLVDVDAALRVDREPMGREELAGLLARSVLPA